MAEFRRILTDSESQSRDRKRAASLKTFNEFLNVAFTDFNSWNDFSLSRPITKDLYEQYVSFLVQKCKTLGTAEAYGSAIRGIVEKDFGADHPIVRDTRWYKNVRRELVKAFVHKCHLNNSSLVSRATPADKGIIESLCSLLFSKGTRESFHDRFLISTQWQALGRPGELGLLNVSDFSWSHSGNCLLGDWSRFKANQESVSQLSFFACNLTWQIDIFHCIGSWNACYGDSSNKAYPLLKDGGVHAYINRVLKNVLDGEEVEASLTGYSLRRGGASTAAQNEHLTIHQIIQRGGWTIDAVSTIFEYICGTTYSDHKVGKVLAGWDNPTCGGFPPSFSFLEGDNAGLEKMWLFCRYLFSQCSCDWVHKVHEHACAALLMYLPDTNAQCPQNAVYEAVLRAASLSHVSEEVITSWSFAIRQDFMLKNLPALPLKVIEGMDPVLASRISVRQETFMSFLDNQTKSIFLLHQANAQMAVQLAHVNHKLDSLLTTMQHLMLCQGSHSLASDHRSVADTNSAAELVSVGASVGAAIHMVEVTPTLPPKLEKLKNITLRNAFTIYYLDKVYLVPVNEDTKRILEPLRRAIDAMKRFLPSGTVIPNWISPADSEYELYKTVIHGLAEQGESGLMDFCQRWRENNASRSYSNEVEERKRRQRNILSNLPGRVKDVRKAESSGFMLPPMPEIFDETLNNTIVT